MRQATRTLMTNMRLAKRNAIAKHGSTGDWNRSSRAKGMKMVKKVHGRSHLKKMIAGQAFGKFM